MIKFDNFNITYREILFSIIIICIAILLGIVISHTVESNFMLKTERVNKSLKIDNNNDLFVYALDTNVGDIINYGKFETDSPVKDGWLKNDYIGYKKETEEYKIHTRVVCTGSGKTRSCHTETYHSWDTIDREENTTNDIIYSSINFSFDDFKNYPWQQLSISSDTINDNVGYFNGDYIYEYDRVFGSHTGDKRYSYEVIPKEFFATTFGKTEDNKYISTKKGKIVIHNEDLETFVENQRNSVGIFKVIFWIIYSLLIVAGVCGFYYIENEWLEDKK